MPANKTQSSIMAKLGQKLAQAHETHKADETVYGGGSDLPGGIRGGIAQINECKFGVFGAGTKHAGEYFYYASAIVLSPERHEGHHVKGLRTQVGPEPLCDTPDRGGDKSAKTVADHVAFLLNEWRKLGIDTKAIKPEQYEAIAESIKKSGKKITFSTNEGSTTQIVQRGGKWVAVQNGKKDLGTYTTEEAAKTAFPNAGKPPMVFHTWGGLFTGELPDAGDGVVDNTATEPTAGGDDQPPSGSEAAAAPADGGDVDDDLDALGVQGDDENDPGQSDAQDRLKELAGEAGISEEDVGTADNWTAVAQMITEAQAAGGEGGEPGYQVDDVYGYKPIHPKTKKAGDVISVQLTAVDEAAQTVSFHKVGDKKTKWAKIAMDKLVDAPS